MKRFSLKIYLKRTKYFNTIDIINYPDFTKILKFTTFYFNFTFLTTRIVFYMATILKANTCTHETKFVPNSTKTANALLSTNTGPRSLEVKEH